MSDYTLIVQPPPVITAVVTVGQGPAGPGGGAGSSYQHTQSSPANEWTVNHNLGYRPNIALTSLGGAEMWGEVLHISINQVKVYFDSPVPGLALCS